jgi:electron transfer flavoprotein beta subunit
VNILVFIKQVADTEARIAIQSDGKSLEIENKFDMNFFDEFAVEEAIRLKEKAKGGQITVATFGTKKAIEALRTAVAMGADRAFLIDSTGVAADDPVILAHILAAFAKQEQYDMILCGRQAIDDENGAIGPMVAEFMGIPHVSAIMRVDLLDGARIEVESEIEGGKEILELHLPALLTAQKGLNTPRVPLITGVMKAMKVSIPLVDPSSLGIPVDGIGPDSSKTPIRSYEAKPTRAPVKIIGGASPEEKVKGLIKALKEEVKAI